jgi:hypothetical protein
MEKYEYWYRERDGEFNAGVQDRFGEWIWEVNYPDLYEDEESGELVESSTIFEDGYMKDASDIQGLEKYLKSIGVLDDDDKLYFSGEVDWNEYDSYAEGGVTIGKYSNEPNVPRNNRLTDSDLSKLNPSEFYKYEVKSKLDNNWHDLKKTEHPLSLSKYGYHIRLKEQYRYTLASGGALETRLKKRLSESFELPMEMAIYVPSTDKANVIISKKEYQNRVEEVERYLSDLFGGYSAVSVDGGYVSDEKGLIQEDVTRVATFGSTEDFESKFTKLVNKVVDWCNNWGQESMGFEFEGDMFYIDKKASFEHGGVMAKGGGIPKSYTHFVIRKSDNKIVFGYDYKGVDNDDIKYYTNADFKDNDWSKAEYSLMTKRALESKGINPYDKSNWSN